MNPEVPTMQPPAAAGDALAVPRIEDNLVRVLSGQEAPQPEAIVAPRPWYRRRRPLTVVFAAAAALLGALAAVLALTVFAASGSADPAAVLKANGYSTLMTLSPSQMGALGDSKDAATLKPYVTGMVIGINGSKAEIVCSLTSAGEAAASAHLGAFGSSLGLGGPDLTWRMQSGDLVVDTTTAALNGSGSQGS